MTLPLLKTALEPIVRRQKLLRLMLGLAAVWLLLAGVAFLILRTKARGSALVVDFIVAAYVGWLLARLAVRAWKPDYPAIAKSVEQQHPDLHALLVTAVEQRPEPGGGLNFLQQRVVVHAVAEVRRRDCVKTVPAWQLAAATTFQFGMLAVLGIAASGLLRTEADVPRAAAEKIEEEINVTPGDVELEKGSGLVVLAKFGHNVPSEAVLILSPVNKPAQRVALVKNLDDPVFGGGVPEVAGDLSYRVEFSGHASRDFHVKIFEHPRLERADARVRHPEFAKLPDKTIADTRRVGAEQGATLDVSFQLNKPVQSASLVAKDGSVVPLIVDPAKAVAELKDFPVTGSKVWELKLKDADGRANKLPATFTLDALPNRRPELKVVTPKGDQRVSPIEELAFRVDAWDDFGLRAAGISYSIGGGGTKEIVLARDSKPDERLHLEHLLKLEDIGVKVDELVSWHVWAEDVGPDGKPRRTEGDMFFAEVRPFEEIYRPGDESAGGQPQQGGAGAEATKLAELQKQIISATWNLKRAEEQAGATAPDEKYLKDEPVVKDSQEEALGMAQKLAEKIEEPKAAALVANVTQEMERALKELTAAEKSTAPLPEALAAEQAAYNGLLKLAAHEFRVKRQQQGKGKGQQGDKQRAQLDQLEMKDEKKRYETQKEAEQPQKEQLAVLNRLKELAQRQQDINERVKELQTAIEEAKTEKEREEARRQLKRLREEEQQLLADADELRQKLDKSENQSRFADERKQLEQTRNDAQQAAESMQKGESSRALAEGKRAEEGFQKMRDDLRKKASGQFKDEMRQMRADARELAQRQQEIAEQLDAKPKGGERRTLDGSSPQEKLSQDFEQQQKGLNDVREQMQRVSSDAEAAEPLLAKQLYDTLRENTQAGTDETLKKAGELARRGYGSQVKQFEEKARGEVEKVKSGVERAAESVLGDEAEALRQARAELDALGRQLDREIAAARPDLAANKDGEGQKGESQKGEDEKSDGQKGDGQKGDGQKGEGQKGDGQKGDGQKGEGQKGEGQKGEGQKGEGQKGEGQKGEGQKGEGQKGDGQKGEGQKGDGQKGEGQKGEGQKGEGEKGDGQKGEGQGGKGQTAQGGSEGASQGSTPGQGQSSGGGQKGSQASAGDPRGERNDAAGGKRAASRLAQLASSAGTRNGSNNGGGGGGGGLDGGPQFDQRAPLTGDGFVDWSDRLRNVEEMLDAPELRREVADIREAAKVMRSEFKREGAQPKWDIVKVQIGKPLAELRDRIGQELARRESKEALVPIDRDPVPVKYSDRVRKYYEELGRSR
jgi:hypothetical protein